MLMDAQMGEVYIVSDTHFDHKNIIKYCNRPFGDVDAMNTRLVNNWNGVVTDNDIVYFLGDITYGKNSRNAKFWLNKLAGHKILIKGNHDRYESGLKFRDYHIIKEYGVEFLLIHNPDYNIPDDFEGWIVHGHHHNNHPDKYPLISRENRTINVSVEMIGYKPLWFGEVVKMALSDSYIPDFAADDVYARVRENALRHIKQKKQGCI